MQRAKWERLRDERAVSQILARSLSPSQVGSDPRSLETTGKLQILQQVEVPNVEKGNLNLSNKDSPMYVGMTPHALRAEKGKDKNAKKNEKIEMGEKLENDNKNIIRKVEDGLLLVVPAKIYGKEVKTLIDSGGD